jgi:16S rRNA (cytosine1402-N4)-methyltransferase
VNGSATEHIPVLAEKLAEQIELPQDAVMVDATIGNGGHSQLFGRKLGPEGVIIGLDVDSSAIRRAQFSLKDLSCRVILLNTNFANIRDAVAAQGFDKVDFVLADLGVCSAQLADMETGLSFQRNMPLDMRLDKRLTTTAADIISEMDEHALADLIYKFGQERASRRIARFIVEHRRAEPIRTTGQLAAIVSRAMGRPAAQPGTRIHPATRTFQALRIAVNDELGNLATLLDAAPAVLKKDGYIAVISFHSLEDGLVKSSFRKLATEGTYTVVTKKPIEPTAEETARNRRARSAKLRIAQRK